VPRLREVLDSAEARNGNPGMSPYLSGPIGLALSGKPRVVCGGFGQSHDPEDRADAQTDGMVRVGWLALWPGSRGLKESSAGERGWRARRDGTIRNTLFSQPSGVAVTSEGTIFVADSGQPCDPQD